MLISDNYQVLFDLLEVFQAVQQALMSHIMPQLNVQVSDAEAIADHLQILGSTQVEGSLRAVTFANPIRALHAYTGVLSGAQLGLDGLVAIGTFPHTRGVV